MEQKHFATTPLERLQMPATVKRISKARSNKKPNRPKQKSTPEQLAAVSEILEPMTVDASAAAPTESVTPPVAAPVAFRGRVVLGASCTIHEASALRAHLIDQASNPGPYEIDGSAVQQIDTAGVQLVVAFALDCLERSIHYVWTGRSPALEEAIRTLGVGALLESPGAASYSPTGAA
jgi:phospholipid transport system transporter-binding protein